MLLHDFTLERLDFYWAKGQSYSGLGPSPYQESQTTGPGYLNFRQRPKIVPIDGFSAEPAFQAARFSPAMRDGADAAA